MRVIIAGSREGISYDDVCDAVEKSCFAVSEVVTGSARGADAHGIHYAFSHNLPVRAFVPNWLHLGKSAGFVRNIEMSVYADALIAVWDGKSKGTEHMIAVAQQRGLRVYIHVPNQLADSLF